jgi:hypothetical protein
MSQGLTITRHIVLFIVVTKTQLLSTLARNFSVLLIQLVNLAPVRVILVLLKTLPILHVLRQPIALLVKPYQPTLRWAGFVLVLTATPSLSLLHNCPQLSVRNQVHLNALLLLLLILLMSKHLQAVLNLGLPPLRAF